MTRPVGNGVMCGTKICSRYKTHGVSARTVQTLVPIIPYPMGRILDGACPRHFMPGYHHTVPPGQVRLYFWIDSSHLSLLTSHFGLP